MISPNWEIVSRWILQRIPGWYLSYTKRYHRVMQKNVPHLDDIFHIPEDIIELCKKNCPTWTISPNWAASLSTSFCRLRLRVRPRMKATLGNIEPHKNHLRIFFLTWSQTRASCYSPNLISQRAGRPGCSLHWNGQVTLSWASLQASFLNTIGWF